MEAHVLVDAEQPAARARGGQHRLGTGAVDAHRLLAQNVLPGPERRDRDRRVERVRQSDRDEIEVGEGKQLLVVGEDGGDPELLARPLVRARGVGVADGADLDAGGQAAPGCAPPARCRRSR